MRDRSAGGGGGSPPRPVPLVRQRRHGAGEGELPCEASRTGFGRGIGLTVAMQAMNSLDQLQPVEGMGPVGEIRLVPGPVDVPGAAVRAADRGDAGRPRSPGRRSRRRVCQRSFLKRMEARLLERGARLEVAFENEFSLATVVDGALRAGRLRPLLLDDQHDGGAGLRRRARVALWTSRGSGSSSTTPSSGTDSTRSRRRTHRRCGQRTSSCSSARRFAASRRGTGSSRRSRRSRGPTTRATAGTSTSRCGRRMARGTGSTTLRRRTGCRRRRAPSSRACSSISPGSAG